MNSKPFQVAGVNYAVNTDGSTMTVTQEGVDAPLFSQPIDQTKSADEAMKEVVVAVDTFLVGAFPGFVAEFLAIFDKLVVTVTAGVPVISIGA